MRELAGGARGEPGDGRGRLPDAQAARLRRRRPRPRHVGRRRPAGAGEAGRRAPGGRARPGERQPRPGLLPPLADVLARLEPAHRLYGGPAKLPELVALAEADFAADGIDGDVAVTGGALDAIERALQTELGRRPGRRRGPELAADRRPRPRARAAIEPVARRRTGARSRTSWTRARRGARAVIATPRGQNPTGAAVDPERARAPRGAGAASGRPRDRGRLRRGRRRRAVRPGARPRALGRRALAVEGARARPAGRARRRRPADDLPDRGAPAARAGLGQPHAPADRRAALAGAATGKLLARAERTYAERRAALVGALAGRGIAARRLGPRRLGPARTRRRRRAGAARPGLGGEPGRALPLRTPPGIRITTADLEPTRPPARRRAPRVGSAAST